MTSATLLAPDRAAWLRSAGLLLALAAGLVASLLIFMVEPISDFLGEGAIRVSGLEGGIRRTVIGLLLSASTVVMVAASWRAGVAGLAVAALAALVTLAAAGPFALPTIGLAAAALIAGAAGAVERDRLDHYAPRRHPLPWAAGSAAAAVLLVVGAAVTWYLVSPLIDEGVELDEALGFTIAQGGETPVAGTPAAAVAPSTPATGEATAAATAAPSGDDGGAAAAPAAAGMLVASGELVGADSFHAGSGRVLLLRGPDGTGLLRFEDYEVRNGPDLHVFLTPDPAGDVHAAGAVDLGEVRATRGNVNYELSPGADLESLRFAVIYCVPFRVVFATAELN